MPCLATRESDEPVIGPTVRGGYTEIARSRRTLPEALALGMLDPEVADFACHHGGRRAVCMG